MAPDPAAESLPPAHSPEPASDWGPVLEKLQLVKAMLHDRSSELRFTRELQLQQLGDYRIVREVGRGGMGIVYEAIEESLQRHVAIKILPALALANSARLCKFQQEAQTAARLHHTHIVPIFAIGQHQEYHYYVMPLIRGQGADAVIRYLREMKECDRQSRAKGSIDKADPTLELENIARGTGLCDGPSRGHHYWRAVAMIGVQVAEALEYAHRQNVLHQDIKPSNLIIDENGDAWIADFGLAKCLVAEAPGLRDEESGTLRYMAPERLGGVSDPRSDVYSLGITLHEFLTLQPAFEHVEHGRLAQQIREGRVSWNARGNGLIPRDLAAIVRKASALCPDDRYQTAMELADDLRAYVSGRAVRARRISTWERATLWCHRNQALATMTSVCLLLLVGLMGVSTWDYFRTREAYRRVQASLMEVARHDRRASEIADESLATLDDIADTFMPATAGPGWSSIKGIDNDEQLSFAVSEHTTMLLESLLRHYQRMSLCMENPGVWRERSAATAQRLGWTYSRLGQVHEAEATLRSAIGLYLQASHTSADAAALMANVGHCYLRLGDVLWIKSQPEEAYAEYRRGRDLLEPLLSGEQAIPAVRHAAAAIDYRLRRRLFTGDLPGWLPRAESDLRTSPTWFGDNHYLHRSVETVRSLVSEFPKERHYRYLLAIALREICAADESIPDCANYHEALNQLQNLAADNAHEPDYRFELAVTYATMAETLDLSSDPIYYLSMERLRSAQDLLALLTRQNPNIYRYAAVLAEVEHRLAFHLLSRTAGNNGARKNALRHLRRADQALAFLINRFTYDSRFREWRNLVHQSMAEINLWSKEPAPTPHPLVQLSGQRPAPTNDP